MTTFKIIQTVKEIYYIEANSAEEATCILYDGMLTPDEYGDMSIDDVRELK